MADINNINPDAFTPILEEITYANMSQDQVLQSIDKSLKEIIRNDRKMMSQSQLSDITNTSRDRGRTTNRRSSFSRAYDDEVDFRWDASRMRRRGQGIEDQIDRFTEEFERQMWQSIAGDPISKQLAPVIRNFADKLGTSVSDLGETLGKKLAENAAERFKSTRFGTELSKELNDIKEDFTTRFNTGLGDLADQINNGGSLSDMIKAFGQNSKFPTSIEDVTGGLKTFAKDLTKLGQNSDRIFNAFQGAFTHGGLLNGLGGAAKAIERIGAGSLSANSALTVLGIGAAGAGAAVLAFEAAVAIGKKVVEKFKEAIKPAAEGAKAFGDAIKAAANREQDYEKGQLQNYKERIKKDYESYIREPFDILKKAADEAYAAWDAVAKDIAQTQGYDKAGLQDLWSNYAQRLQEEGLSSVVSSADILTNLKRVLESGMSGSIAEEFAYIATVLDNAIPTEEFFNYASTYASIAANAVKDGKSQTEAIKLANEQLEQFASNLLYSSRQLAGGFTTGLANASDLFASASNIAVAAHTNNTAEISGVLTSVSAIVGAIAPDLTSSIVQKITDAATGGNSSELTALRSLAGTGASNTAFLQAFAKDPQAVFVELFSNLAQMQNMYGDNYMEVAEGLASTFGLSMDAMSRIDFGYLAQAVSAMDTNNASLEENLSLLASGQTTLTADQLRMQQINQYMIDEGLSYVLDNEVARAIQEHMWEEQLANQIMENTYSTELTGASLELFQGIQFTLENLFTMLNPLGWMKKVEALVATSVESEAMSAEIKAMLEKGNLGKSNPATLYKLTTGNTDLKLAKRYIELLGGTSLYGIASNIHSTVSSYMRGGVLGLAGNALKSLASSAIMSSRKGSTDSAVSSYKWSTIGKSITRDLFTTGNRALYNSGSAYDDINMDPQSIISSKAAKRMQDYLDTMQSYVDEGKSYDEWAADATNYGFEDLGAALGDYGLTEVQAKGKFQEMEAVKAAQYQHERDLKEEQFWDDMIKWAEEDFPLYSEKIYEYNDDILAREDMLVTNTDLMITELVTSNKKLKEFYDQWIDYYVNHTAYHRDTLNAHEIEAIKTAEAGETGDAVFALAQALTDNLVNLQDPQVQTNALLSQMLLVVEAIFQLQNNTTTVSLPTALSSLGLGVTSVDNQY